MKTLLIVGRSFHTLREYIVDNGMDYVTLRDQKTTNSPAKKLKHRVVCDFTSQSTIDTALQELTQRFKIDGVLTTYESYVPHAAYISSKLGLSGLSVKSAAACTDKELMREYFKHAERKISPDFAEASSKAAVIDFAKNHGYPLILKPANLSKSLLVTKNHNLNELIHNYQKTVSMIDAVYARYAPGRIPKLLIEEFMVGPIHSVDAFVDAGGVPHVLDAVVDYQTGYDIGYDDNFHYSRVLPSALDPSQIAEIRETAAIGCRALQMKSSPAHIEIIRTADGPMIVEIGARNGGYRERMHALANGIDITGNAIRLALNEKLVLESKISENCAVLELFPKTSGVFTGISNEDELKNLRSLNYISVKQPLGTHVGKSSEGYKMCAIIILHHRDKAQFERDLQYVRTHVKVVTA